METRKIENAYILYFGEDAADDRILVVDIDDEDIDELLEIIAVLDIDHD